VTRAARGAGAKRALVALFLAVGRAGPAVAQAAVPPADSAAPIDSAIARDTALERRTAEIAARLRCPVCQGLSILDSPSELAQNMRRLVRDQLAAGRTPAEIEAYFINSYGEWVLLKPPARGANLTVWLLPGLLLLGGGWVVWVAVRRWVRQGAAGGGGSAGTAVPEAGSPQGGAVAAVLPATLPELQARRDALRRALSELDAELADGELTRENYDLLKRRDETELAAVRAALKQRRAPPAAAARPQPAARPRRRVPPAVMWGGGIVAFGVVAVISLRGSVATRTGDNPMTGIQFGGGDEPAPAIGAPIDAAQLASLEGRVARDSNDYAALLELGHLYLRQQRMQPAAVVSIRAIQLRPRAKESGEGFAHLAMILWSSSDVEPALQAIEQALQLDPNQPEALLYKGIILFAGANDPAGAVSAWERYLEVAPPGAETARVRGMLEAARQQAR
jgi:cytochrome c-type biogenesis protein CcmH